MKMNGITTSFRRGKLPRKALATLVVATIFFAVPTAAQESVLDRLIQRTRSGKSSAPAASPADTETPEPTATSNTDPIRGTKTSKTKIPRAGPQQNDKIKVESQDGLISIVVRDAPLSEVLDLLAHEKGLNLVTAENIKANVSINLNRVKLTDALDTVLAVAGYTWVRDNDIIIVTSLTGTSKLAPHTQGRVLRVFRLDYASAREVSTVIAGFLSPAGQSFLSQTTMQDNRKTQDIVVVEDVPLVVERVAQYIGQVDVPPRQVLIEARILQVTLRDNYVNGVNLLIDELSKDGHGRELRIDMQANPLASPAFLFTSSRKDLNVLVELLETTTDAKNLASPKVLVVNGQEAHFQVGQRIGYKQVTTTETSSQESIGFLDVGVQLRVRPYISGDNNVLMHVKPEVSSGRINVETGAPDAEIIQVDTDVLLPDGRGMVIGGLIQEEDSNLQSKVPVLGNLWLVGRLFQRRQVNKERKEVIIVLVPTIVPHATVPPTEHEQDVQRSLTPLFEGQLNRVSRPWEPRMPDAVENPVLLRESIPKLPPLNRDSRPWEPRMPDKVENRVLLHESVPRVRLLRLGVPSNTYVRPFNNLDGSINSECPVQPTDDKPVSNASPSDSEQVEIIDPVNPQPDQGGLVERIEE